MSLTDATLIPTLYDSLASPVHSRRSSASNHPTIDLSSTTPRRPTLHLDIVNDHDIAPAIPTPLPGSKDSLTREKQGDLPVLAHLLGAGRGRVLSLAADDRYVYSGSQSADNGIVVFSRTSLQPLYRLLGHTGSVLALMVVKEKNWLVSASSGGDVRIWSTKTLTPIYIIHPCDDTSGDVYTLAWDNRAGGTLYFGSQNTSIEWVNFGAHFPSRTRKTSNGGAAVAINGGAAAAAAATSPSHLPQATASKPQRSGRYRPHKFFDSWTPAQSGASTPSSPQPYSPKGDLPGYFSSFSEDEQPPAEVKEIEVPSEGRLATAHYGYVYAMELIQRKDEVWLVSGSGDSDVKIWRCLEGGGLENLREFGDLRGAVLSLATRDSLLFAGLQDGQIMVWDLETGACIRSIMAHEGDVLSMSVLGTDLYTAAADGRVLRFNRLFDCTAAFRAHSGIILSSLVVPGTREKYELYTAGNDSFIKIWAVDLPESEQDTSEATKSDGDVMLYALSKLVAIPTVSDDAHREDCRQGAHLLRKILLQLGAKADLLMGSPGKNPIVHATFTGHACSKPRKRVLFYGHYDVQPAVENRWQSDPWKLSGRNGYLYGRGVSDNKGPILAVACAAAALRDRRELDVDVVLLIEGEEEAGSTGFAEAVQRHKADIGHIDVILLSNSTWLGEDNPCVVFGMRGVIYAGLTVSNDNHDAHSGVDGGAVQEPMIDMVRLLSSIGDANKVKIPGFYDAVRNQDDTEQELLKAAAAASDSQIEDLVRKWRHPTFSIANVSSSGASNNTIIPRRVTSDVSFRLVPDQDLDVIVKSIRDYCENSFGELKSNNKLELKFTHQASWWLASLEDPYLKALERAVEKVWGVAPLKIREGGTIPTINFLEREFGAPVVHLPLGQASDAAHLPNERIRLQNLRHGKRVIEEYLVQLADI